MHFNYYDEQWFEQILEWLKAEARAARMGPEEARAEKVDPERGRSPSPWAAAVDRSATNDNCWKDFNSHISSNMLLISECKSSGFLWQHAVSRPFWTKCDTTNPQYNWARATGRLMSFLTLRDAQYTTCPWYFPVDSLWGSSRSVMYLAFICFPNCAVARRIVSQWYSEINAIKERSDRCPSRNSCLSSFKGDRREFTGTTVAKIFCVPFTLCQSTGKSFGSPETLWWGMYFG